MEEKLLQTLRSNPELTVDLLIDFLVRLGYTKAARLAKDNLKENPNVNSPRPNQG